MGQIKNIKLHIVTDIKTRQENYIKKLGTSKNKSIGLIKAIFENG